jgi:hypothetical protein
MLNQNCFGRVFTVTDPHCSSDAAMGRLALKKQQHIAARRLRLDQEAVELRRQRSLEVKRTAAAVLHELAKKVATFKASARVKTHRRGREV